MAHCLACACAHCMQQKNNNRRCLFLALVHGNASQKNANFDVILLEIWQMCCNRNMEDMNEGSITHFPPCVWMMWFTFDAEVDNIHCGSIYIPAYFISHTALEKWKAMHRKFPARDDRGFFPELCLPDTICQCP